MDIDKQVDRLIAGRKAVGKRFKRTRTLVRLSPSTLMILAIAIAGGMLLGFIWTTYTIHIQGDIDVNGGEGEAVLLYYDNILLNGTGMTITTMDITTINAGETITVVHRVDNLNGQIVCY